jgi:hypothetical protein
MIRSRLQRGLLAASPVLAFLLWYSIARPTSEVLVYVVLGVAGVATFILHRVLPWPKK